MSVIVPIYQVRLGNSDVATPNLALRVTKILHQEEKVLGYLEGSDDLVLSILKAKNGKANLGDRWVQFSITKHDDAVEVCCEEKLRVSDLFKWAKQAEINLI